MDTHYCSSYSACHPLCSDSQSPYQDGGTREWIALTYKIVKWNRLSVDGSYEKVRFYGPADKGKSIDELWKLEEEKIGVHMTATVVSIDENTALVESVEDGQLYLIRREGLEDIGAAEGSVVDVHYSGALLYSDPPTIASMKSWKLSKNFRHLEYTEQWIDKSAIEKSENNVFDHIVITEIYSNCFFASTVIPMPYTIKLNGALSDEWCVGDQIMAICHLIDIIKHHEISHIFFASIGFCPSLNNSIGNLS